MLLNLISIRNDEKKLDIEKTLNSDISHNEIKKLIQND